MSALYFLITISMVVAICFLAAFIWAVKSGQMKDTHTPSLRILFDSHFPSKSKKTEKP